MGMIGKLFTAVTGIALAADRALLDTMCLASAVDGARSDVEQGYALEIALDLEGFRRMSRDELERALAEARARVASDADLATSLARLAAELGSNELREQAFTLAAVIVAVDHDVRDVEHAFLSSFRQALGLSAQRAAEIWSELEAELKST